MALVSAFAGVMSRRLYQAIDTHEQRLDRVALRLMRPADLLRRQAQRLAWLQQRMQGQAAQRVPRQRQRCLDSQGRLQRASAVAIAAHRQRLASLRARLGALDPRQVLARGYAWLTDGEGRPIASVEGVAVGQVVQAQLVDGSVRASVSQVMRGADE
jgi:exodeoxyribonuclease VII large subunit